MPFEVLARAVCRAALEGHDSLYEVMLKVSLMIESIVPTYGLSIWTRNVSEAPRLQWVEGLNNEEIDLAGETVDLILRTDGPSAHVQAGDNAVCLSLAAPNPLWDGAAIYARCMHPLTEHQAKKLNGLADVARLAHAYVAANAKPSVKTFQHDKSHNSSLPGMVFNSRAMAEVARAVERIKDSESAILITGESGTGKELIARAIHRLSKRSAQEFVPFNCAAVPAELVESILFGHRKGSFTGALSENSGLIRAAANGTLFLDEIGDLPLALQPKLLRFLQEGEVHTLGEHSPRKVYVRVIAATHKDLDLLVKQKAFREDLYYRIATLQISIPPLRDRPEDVATLISHFLTHYSRRNDRAIAGITWDAIRALQAYSWPGNIRELAAEIERLVLYAEENSYITIEHVSSRIVPQESPLRKKTDTARSLDELLDDYERQLITETLKQHDCNVARTSEALGLGSRQTLYKKLKRLAIDVSMFLQEDTEPGLQYRADR